MAPAIQKEIVEWCDKRIDGLEDRINGVVQGRVMPDIDQVTIGSGKLFRLSVLFLDICNFSSRLNWTPEEQKEVLCVMNIFMGGWATFKPSSTDGCPTLRAFRRVGFNMCVLLRFLSRPQCTHFVQTTRGEPSAFTSHVPAHGLKY